MTNLKALLAVATLALTVAAPASAGLSDSYHQQRQRVGDYKAHCELIQRNAEYRVNHTAYVVRGGVVWASSYGDCVAEGRLGAVEPGRSGETRKQWVIESGHLVLYVQNIESGTTSRLVYAASVR